MTSPSKIWVKGLFLCLLALLIINPRVFAFDKRSSYALSHYIMAVMYDDLGQIDKAIAEYKLALKADYKNSVIHLNLAVSYLKNNNFPDAIKELNTVVKLTPDAVEPHAILALLYAAQNKTTLATYEYELALKNASKLEPKNTSIYKTLGLIYIQQKKMLAAESTYKLIVELAPNDAEAHFYLGSVYFELKNKNKAIAELKKTLELKPDYAEALNYLGYLYVEENRNLGQAEAMIKKALEIDPNNGAYIDSLGWLYFKKGKLKEAIKELENASTLLEDPVIHDHLGDAYLKIGDAQKAKISWQNSLKLDSRQDKVKEKIEKVKMGSDLFIPNPKKLENK